MGNAKDASRLISALVAALALSGFTGCTKPSEGLTAAQSLGASADALKSSTDKLANDIYLSCIRKTRYYRVYPDLTMPRRDADEERANALAGCEQFNRVSASNAVIANDLIYNYIKAIGELSLDKQVQFNSEFEAVAKALDNFQIPGTSVKLSPESTKTGAQIASFVFEWAASRYREGELAQAIVCVDKPLQAYSTELRRVYTEGYINGILGLEKARIRHYYKFYSGLLAVKEPNVSSMQKLDGDSYDAYLPAIQNELAARSYLELIKATADAHTKVSKIFIASGYSDSDRTCASFFNPRPAKQPIQRSHSNPQSLNISLTKLPPKERLNLAMILLDFQQKAEPLIQAIKASPP